MAGGLGSGEEVRKLLVSTVIWSVTSQDGGDHWRRHQLTKAFRDSTPWTCQPHWVWHELEATGEMDHLNVLGPGAWEELEIHLDGPPELNSKVADLLRQASILEVE